MRQLPLDIGGSLAIMVMNESKNKLAIVHITAHDVAGGASKVAQRLSVSQRNRGHDSKMLVGGKRSSSEHVFSFPLEADPYILGKCRNEGLLDYEFQGSHRLISHPIIRSADIVHLHILHGGYFNPFSLSILSHVKPIVWTLHDMQAFTGHCAHSFDCERWKSGCGKCPDLSIYPEIPVDTTHALWEEKKLIYNHSRFQLVMPSQWLKEKIRMSILGDHLTELIPNGVDTKIFRPFDKLEMRRLFHLPEDAILIGAIADHGIHANAFKGGRYAMQAIRSLRKKMPSCFFISIGSGGNSCDPHVINIPRIEDESALAKLYSTLDIYLLTSIAENCPLVVLEAMACGIPVVSFATGGVPELVRNEVDGYVVKQKEVSLLMKALIRLKEDPRLRERFSLNARQRAVSSFDHDSIAKRYENVYSRLLERQGERRKIDPIPIERLPKIIQTKTLINVYNLLSCNGNSTDKSIPHDRAVSGEGKRPIVSAIVSTYNSERFIRGCIEDLEAQTIADRIEIITVNSGSEQNEEAIIRELQNTYSNIKHIKTQERETVYGAWNRGIESATGKYITNANADDRHRRDAFERMVNVLEMRSDIALVYADVIKTEAENEIFDNCTKADQYRWYDWDRNILLEKGCFMGPQPMWRREVHELYGYFDDSLVSSGDYEFWLRISQTFEFLHIGMPLGLYLIRPESIEHNENETKQREDLEIQRQYLEAINKRRLIKFQPFYLVRRLTQNTEAIDTVELETAIHRIEELADIESQAVQMNPPPSNGLLQGNDRIRLFNNLKRLLLRGESDDNLIEFFFQVASELILRNTSWFKENCNQFVKTGATGISAPLLRQDITGDLEKVNFFRDKGGLVMKSSEELYKGVGRMIDNGRQEEAIKALENLLNAYPDYAPAHNDLGVLHYNQGNKAAALEHYQKAAQLCPENITFQKNLADFYYVEMGRVQDALRIYVNILTANPKDTETLMITGHICVALQQFEDAKVFYTRIMEIEPWNMDARENLDKIEKLEKAGKKKKSKEEIYQNIQTMVNDARPGEAIDALKELLNVHPDYALAHNDLGVLYYNQGNKEKALEHYVKAVQLLPKNITFQKNLADFYYVEMGRIEEALRIYVDILAAHPRDIETLMITGHICVSLQQFEDAKVFYRRILEIEPQNSEAQNFLHKLEQRTDHLQVSHSIQKATEYNQNCQEVNYSKRMAEIESSILSIGLNDAILFEALKIREKLGPMEIDRISNDKNTVSLCMIVKDEEQQLAKCLSSVKPVVDEMIIVDTGSTDRTKDIAKIFGARVYDFKWNSDFSEARNFSISHASGKWIFILDADEIISPKDYDTFKMLVKIQASKPVAYSFETRNYTFHANTVGWIANDGEYPKEEAGIGWFPSNKVRLFQNSNHHRFQFPVHEMIDPSLKAAGEEIVKCSIPIHHYGEVNKGKVGDKAESYFRIGQEKLSEEANDIAAIRELAVQAGNLGRWMESINLWEKVLAVKPDFAEAYINIGTANWNLGKYDTALEHAKKAIELAPNMKEAHFNYAISSLFLGNAKEAAAVLVELAAKLPDYLPAQFMLGAAFCCDGRKEEGLSCFNKLRNTSVGPGLPFAFHDLAKRVFSARKTEYAISLLNAAIESRNSNEDVVALLDECLGT